MSREKYKKSIFVFRRDLRLADNTALKEAMEKSEVVLACFIFDPRQVDKNSYKSSNALEFMLQSLVQLQEEIEKKKGSLYFFYGKSEEVIDSLIKDENIEGIFLNEDYTPFSKKRDLAIQQVCEKNKISFNSFSDALLNKPGSILNKSKRPYTIFTPFFKYASTLPVSEPSKITRYKFYSGKVKGKLLDDICRFLKTKNPDLACKGGRKNALQILSRILDYKDYEQTRDFPELDSTSHLSAHLKFGTCSPREVYHRVKSKLGTNHPLLRQLYWRDFFYHIAFHFPYVFKGAFYKKYDSIKWSENKKVFKLWCEGKTGFPIVDAGMKELNATGYMHNRVRMITASFLIKDLHINWQWGEKYFAQKLVDYDPCLNNGNWQWAASTGCDAQPYFRIFNPWLQQKRFDKNSKYIAKWLGDLSSGYIEPIVDHSVEAQISKKMYSSAA